ISELLQRIQATGLLRRYAPRNDGPKNRTVQRFQPTTCCFLIVSWIISGTSRKLVAIKIARKLGINQFILE
ncbi:hypothetical protein, partial [Legionella pneumophila]